VPLAAARALDLTSAYIALQKGLGADRLRHWCFDKLDLAPGMNVLDVGCGPAYYLDRLPEIHYWGYDTSEPYIRWARRQWKDRQAEFFCETLTPESAASLPQMDAVLLMGVLHHLSDDESRSVLALCSGLLRAGGAVMALDTCYDPSQTRVERWLAEHDRGEYVREPNAFVELARESFAEVQGELVHGLSRVPMRVWAMRMAGPTAN